MNVLLILFLFPINIYAAGVGETCGKENGGKCMDLGITAFGCSEGYYRDATWGTTSCDNTAICCVRYGNVGDKCSGMVKGTLDNPFSGEGSCVGSCEDSRSISVSIPACNEKLVCCYATGVPIELENFPTDEDGGVSQKPANEDAGTGKASTTTPGGSTKIDFVNPLGEANDVTDVSINILNYLQGVVVVVSLVFLVISGILYIVSAGDERKMESAKKAMTASLIGLAIIMIAPSFLNELITILGGKRGNLDTTQLSGALEVSVIANNALLFLLSIVGTIAIIGLLIGSIMYLTAMGDEKKMENGKKLVKASLIGVLVAMSALVIVKQIAELIAGKQ